MSNYRVIVTTSDKYLPALRPFMYLFNKYWSKEQEVLVAGFSNPRFALPNNFTFLSIGKQRDYPFKKWSDALIHLLKHHGVNDEAFILMLEDYWLTRHVNLRAVEMLYDYAVQFKYTLKIDLTGDRLYARGADRSYGVVNYLDLVKSMPGSPYHMSLMCGVWRRDNLLKALKPGESPHDIELHGTTRVSHLQELLVLGTRQWPVRHTLGLRGGDHSTLKLDELQERDINELREKGYFEPWEKKEKSEKKK